MQGLWTMLGPVMPWASMSFAFARSNLPGRVIVFVLFLGSIVVWSVMVTKFRELWGAQRHSERFLKAFRDEPHPLSLFRKGRLRRNAPLAEIYVDACDKLEAIRELPVSSIPAASPGGSFVRAPLGSVQLRVLRNTVEQSASNRLLALEEGMGFLATATTTAPFLGLLGTVWGVMDAFRGMGETALLSAVAPGISGALLTTVVGLLVALPSAIGYNALGSRIRRITVAMEQFSEELLSAFETGVSADEV